MEFSFSPLLGILGAAILGGAIGLQRQAAHKPAGFRTHLIVAAASAAFTAMGAHLNDTRIPSYIVVGIGFLGAGAIIRQNGTAHGLTTAASIWMAAAVGLLLGYSNSFGLVTGLVATAITLGALSIPDESLMRAFRMKREANVRVVCASGHMALDAIARILAAERLAYDSKVVSIVAQGTEETIEVQYSIELEIGKELTTIVQRISALNEVHRVEASEPFFAG
ncbi:MAG TPA: MgtC/SapB family protein [Candidatus Rubrimentiphilum sp.]|nr:MgtC/SapB family protein [Candidatus Rubrimentiphilum sp.]